MTVHVVTNVRTGRVVRVEARAERWVRRGRGTYAVNPAELRMMPTPPHEMPVKVRSR